MCTDCGCVETGHEHQTTFTVGQNLLERNEHLAAHNRQHFDGHRILALNLMSSPGSGKTSLLEATIRTLKAHGLRIAVIEGDLETENDAERIRKQGVQAIQITTGSACHLDAHMIHHALEKLPLHELDIVFIENVGNLVCPAEFALGQHHDVVLLSVTEGDDKPDKYPVIFRSADHVLISKADLLPYLQEFDPDKACASIKSMAPDIPVSVLSSKTGTNMDAWINWILQKHNDLPMDTSSIAHTHTHHHHAPSAQEA